jgi:hypothetical protein
MPQNETVEQLIRGIADRCDEVVARWKRERVDHKRTKEALDVLEAEKVANAQASAPAAELEGELKKARVEIARLQDLIYGEDGLERRLARHEASTEDLARWLRESRAENGRLHAQLAEPTFDLIKRRAAAFVKAKLER